MCELGRYQDTQDRGSRIVTNTRRLWMNIGETAFNRFQIHFSIAFHAQWVQHDHLKQKTMYQSNECTK